MNIENPGNIERTEMNTRPAVQGNINIGRADGTRNSKGHRATKSDNGAQYFTEKSNLSELNLRSKMKSNSHFEGLRRNIIEKPVPSQVAGKIR